MKCLAEIDKLHQYYTENRIICKCGHSVFITSKDGKTLCSHCHKYVFANEELEKKYRKEEFIKTLKSRI